MKVGTYPTGTSYDQMDDSESTNIDMEISPTVSGVYYIGLYGYWDVSYNVSLTLQGNYNFRFKKWLIRVIIIHIIDGKSFYSY